MFFLKCRSLLKLQINITFSTFILKVLYCFVEQKEVKAATLPRKMKIGMSSSQSSQGYRSLSNQESLSPRSDQSAHSDTDDLLDPNFINHNNNVVKPRVVTLTKTSAPLVNSAQSSQEHSSINRSSSSTSYHAIKTNTLVNGATSDLNNVPPQASLPPVTHLDIDTRVSRDVSSHSNQIQNGGNEDMPPVQLYRAIKDYDPRLYSRSGQPHLELSLREGVIVKALGGVNSKGYMEAQCNGKVGLVPMNYLEPVRERRMSVQAAAGRLGLLENVGDSIVQVHAEFARSQTIPNSSGMFTFL